MVNKALPAKAVGPVDEVEGTWYGCALGSEGSQEDGGRGFVIRI